ncbi:copper homeostasis protein CutC [Rhodocytophaga aerolata]|uniref:PF03932 family protein CutC n=1 Tax=Rhodocytophaga aerolata TaxID=455078 RepID=A0ABT8R115_9BACT|nr:copper homeostasis protein CutC [Rhodocytophaga aerolata]MDO1445786.1 copper homeostasis protein CutC [Rhodocytophaga aerolata]
MTKDITIEVCIDSVQSAIEAQQGGANRVELCDNLFEGGTTPSAGAIAIARKNITIGLHVMIRPRGGDFYYSDIEFDCMKKDIQIAKELGADGVVFGLLTKDGRIDIARSKELTELALPLQVTFHRAFDMTIDPVQALEDIISIKGITRLLTSGQEKSAPEGAELIADLVKQANGRISIMPGAGIYERNIAKMKKITGASEFHVTGYKTVHSQMEYRNPTIFMGGTLSLPEYDMNVVDSSRIQAMRSAAQ